MKYLFILISIFVITSSFTQEEEGVLIIRQHADIEGLIKHQKDINDEADTKPGFRIQIMFSNSRSEAYNAKAKFFGHFPKIPSYVQYDQIYYKLRVGNFDTRLEAYKMLKLISEEYNGALIVPSPIEMDGK